MCRMQGLLCIIIRGCAGGYNNGWDARSFVYHHKGRQDVKLPARECDAITNTVVGST